jgi:hypothetical protein
VAWYVCNHFLISCLGVSLNIVYQVWRTDSSHSATSG